MGREQTGRGSLAGLELYKAIERTRATWCGPSPDRLARFDARLLARSAEKKNRLTDGIVAANNYCRAPALRCDFELQPLIGFRRSPAGPETKIVQPNGSLYPRRFLLPAHLYRNP